MPKNYRLGFTLIELSIVLVIIGLIIGGVLVGRDLIHAAELRSITTAVEKYKTAVNAFRIKYNGLPGDLANATTYFDVDPNGCPTNAILTPRTGTCNGDGDGFIGNALIPSTNFEFFRAWQQLSDAGLINAFLAGVAGTANVRDAIIGVNVPANIGISAGFSFYNEPNISSTHPDRYQASSGNSIMFGGYFAAETVAPVINPQDAYVIDQKIDDGLPGSGSVLSFKPTSFLPNCTTTTDPTTSAYNFTMKGNVCSLIFMLK